MADWTLPTTYWSPFELKRLYWIGRQAAHTPRPDSIMLQYKPEVQITKVRSLTWKNESEACEITFEVRMRIIIDRASSE